MPGRARHDSLKVSYNLVQVQSLGLKFLYAYILFIEQPVNLVVAVETFLPDTISCIAS